MMTERASQALISLTLLLMAATQLIAAIKA